MDQVDSTSDDWVFNGRWRACRSSSRFTAKDSRESRRREPTPRRPIHVFFVPRKPTILGWKNAFHLSFRGRSRLILPGFRTGFRNTALAMEPQLIHNNSPSGERQSRVATTTMWRETRLHGKRFAIGPIRAKFSSTLSFQFLDFYSVSVIGMIRLEQISCVNCFQFCSQFL